MSIQAVAQVLEKSKAKGTAKLVLVVLANRINPETGMCFPSVGLIARETGVKPRQVQNILRALVDAGELVVHYRTGRASLFSLPTMPIPEEAPRETPIPLQSIAPLQSITGGGAIGYTPTPAMDYTLKQKINPKRNGKSGKAALPPTSRHPAIDAFREATGRFPPRAVFDKVIEALGDQPDIHRLREVFSEWVGHGFNPGNITGILDWYANGIPLRAVPGSNGKGRVRVLIDPDGNEVEVAS